MPNTNECRRPILVVRNCSSTYQTGAVSSQLEKHKQENDPLHPLYQQDPARKILKSRHGFLHSVEPIDTSQALLQPKGIAPSKFEWGMDHVVKPKSLSDKDWTMQTRYAEMGIQRGWTDIVWVWTDKHLLVYPILPQPSTHEDLEKFNPELDHAPRMGQ